MENSGERLESTLVHIPNNDRSPIKTKWRAESEVCHIFATTKGGVTDSGRSWG